MAETVCQLEYENQMFLELVSEDGLLILAKGLGIDRLFLKLLKLYSDPHNLVLAIGTSPNHEKYFNNELIKQGVNFIPKSISNQIAAKERQSIYLEGGVLYVTSRILVVDMLKMVCPLDKVSGILVYNAHRVNDVSNEAFILRLYKDHNKDGFVKGLSDSPELFTSGFCQLERIMKNLFVRQVYIWPRFHAVVGATLDKHQPDVIELRQQMSHNMILIQQAILDIMKTCIKELKACNKSVMILFSNQIFSLSARDDRSYYR
jgi:DNA excision repair protein ERCC-4